MSLYFEPEAQAASFLYLCGVGLLLAFLFDGISLLLSGSFKPLGDIFAFLLCGILLLGAFVILRADELRFYYALAVLTGAILYVCGLRRCFLAIGRWLSRLLHRHHKP